MRYRHIEVGLQLFVLNRNEPEAEITEYREILNNIFKINSLQNHSLRYLQSRD
jgi:hypothetical protein